MKSTYTLKMSDDEIIHFVSDNNRDIEQIKRDAFKVLGRIVVDVIDEQSENKYGRSTTKMAGYMRTYYAKLKRTRTV